MHSLFKLFCFLSISNVYAYVFQEHKTEDSQTGEKYAVLVAGSFTWQNYRHQANICHAYQILKQHGFNEENIIVMMYDDIAHHPLNSFKGMIFNQPGGPNVYEGVHVDYKGKDVTPENFLKILRGENMTGIGSGKTLNSGHNDRVFINMVDHGGPGIFCFPREVLFATDFLKTLKFMHINKQYREMVIYVESCESGSLFEHLLPNDIDIYAITSSNSKLPSYAIYPDYELRTFLGDFFSINWMEDADRENLSKETLDKQYHIVKKETYTSPVQRFGNIELSKQHLSEYFGETETSPEIITKKCNASAIRSHDIPIVMLEMMMDLAQTDEEKITANDMYIRLHQNRQFVTGIVWKISLSLTKNANLAERITHEDYLLDITDWDCYNPSVAVFHQRCFNLGLNNYALRHVKVFNSLCEHGFSSEQIIEQIHKHCNHPETVNIH